MKITDELFIRASAANFWLVMHHAGNELHEMQCCMLNGTRPFEQMVMHNNNLKMQLCLIIYCIHVSA